MTTIGVAIPCYGPHITKLTPLLQSIEAQTRRPDQVVIMCSGARAADVAQVDRDWSFPLDIQATTDRRNAAQNRNAAARILTTDLVSYIDADDRMHPQRLEIVTQVSRDTGVDIVLHGCVSPPSPAFDAPFQEVRPPWPVAVNAPGAKHPAGSQFSPMHSHVTVTRDLAQTIGQPENLSFERREDTEFVDLLVAKPGIRSAFIDLGLSKYESAGAWEGAPAGSGEYALGAAGTAARRLMNLPAIGMMRTPVQAFWRSLPLSIRRRFLR
jgi:hypothetical protein